MSTRDDSNDRLSELLRTPTPTPSSTQRHEEKSITDRAAEARDRAQETAERVRQRTDEASHEAAERVDSAMNVTGDRLHDAARTLRERAPSGQVGDVAESAARALERSGDYLRQSDVETVRSDLETVIRDHPIQSLAVGFGVGFMIARTMRPRRGYYG